MAVRKKADFDNILAANAWVDLNRKFIQVLSFENVLDDWGYPTSARLKRPRVILNYLDFRERPEPLQVPNGALIFEGYFLLSSEGDFLIYE